MVKDSSPSHSKEFATLLEELRVLLPGVEVLFAFLLTVPFTERFSSMTAVQRHVYFAAFIASASASVALIAPGVYHRIRWREVDKEQVLRMGNRMAITGTSLLALAISAAVFVVTDMLFARWLASLVTAIIAGSILGVWYVLPLWARYCREGSRCVDEGAKEGGAEDELAERGDRAIVHPVVNGAPTGAGRLDGDRGSEFD
jgi:hypothetical protein